MQQDIGDTNLSHAQGVVGNVAGSVYFGEGQGASKGRSCTSSREPKRSLTHRLHSVDKALAACRTAIYLTDPSIDRDKIVRAKGNRTQGTCEWIKSDPRFQAWLKGARRLLWIRGGPGKGKTIMSVYLTEQIASADFRNLAYYFCVGQEMERNSASGVLRGLLWQITGQHPDLLQRILPYFDIPERGRATVSSEETLWKLFEDMCGHVKTERLYCLVDGIDECDEDSMHWLVDKFTGVGRGNDHPKLSLIVLSRPVAGLRDSDCITLDPDHCGNVSADVAIFVRSKVEHLSRKLGLDESFGQNAVSTLLEKSEGTFLWVGFVMDELLKKKTRSQIEKAIQNLPKGLPAFYARMLHSIDEDDRETSQKLLAYVALSFEPLGLEELADLLGSRSSATISRVQATLDAVAICAPMIQLQERIDDIDVLTAEFVHQSAKDYLLREPVDRDPVLQDFQINSGIVHLDLARHCLRSLETTTQLHYYSRRNWPKHARHLNDLAFQLFESEAPFFGEHSVVRNKWWLAYILDFPGLPNVVPPRFHIACFLGLQTWARAILLDKERSGETVEETVHEKCPGGWLALDYAAHGTSEGFMKFLTEDLLKDKYSPEQLESSLHRAVLTQSEEVVDMCIAERVPGPVERDGGTMAHVRLSLETGANLDVTKDDMGRNSLHLAIQHGSYERSKALRALGPPQIFFNMPPRPPIQWVDAVHSVNHLHSVWADANTPNRNGETSTQIVPSFAVNADFWRSMAENSLERLSLRCQVRGWGLGSEPNQLGSLGTKDCSSMDLS